MSTHLTHFNGREIATVLQTQARLCVWYVEQDAEGRLCRRPFWGRAFDYDPSSGLKVWLDGAQSEADCEWVDEGDDWEWETPEQAAERHGAVQLKLNINDHPLCVRLPFKRPATGEPTTTNASESAPEPDGERSRPESPYTFAKKAKLLRAAAAQEAAQQLLQASHAAALQAYSAGVRHARPPRMARSTLVHPPPTPSPPESHHPGAPLLGEGLKGLGGYVLRDFMGRLGQRVAGAVGSMRRGGARGGRAMAGAAGEPLGLP